MKTLYRGGAVYTTHDPFATALLVDGDTVAWVGGDEAAQVHPEVDAVVELDGALVTPAFVDAHVHLTETGLAMDGVDLVDARSVAEVLARVEAASRRGRGRPVSGHGWDERLLAERRPPTRAELDRAAAGGAVYLSRIDVHSAVVSSALAAACGAASLDGWSPDGRVERDAHHAARATIRGSLAPAERTRLQELALRAAAAAGIAAVHEMGAPHVSPEHDLAGLTRLADSASAENRPVPHVVPFWASRVADEQEARAVLDRFAAEGVRLAGLGGDLNVDGSIGSRTAAFREPYEDRTTRDAPSIGRRYLTADEVAEQVVACTLAGTRTGFHAIGDAAIAVVLDGVEAATRTLDPGRVIAAGHRLEHAEAADADAVQRIARLGLTVSMQPAFDALWGGPDGMYAHRLGRARAAALNPFAPLAAAGVPLVFGSDTPVTPFDPWAAVQAAAFPHEPGLRISVRAAFAAHTRGAWRATGQPERGVLRPGSDATLAVWSPTDLVVQAPDERVQTWSTDPRSGTPVLPDVSPGTPLPRCYRTVLGGRILYDGGDLETKS